MRMRMKNRKNAGSRELKNLQLPPSPIKEEYDDEENLRNINSPYSDAQSDYGYPERDCTEAYRFQLLESSRVSLDYYNKRHVSYQTTNYELVEPVDMLGFSFGPIWVHVNFTAKPKSAPNDANSSIKLFFGEVYYTSHGWLANKCFILKGKSGHCDFCEAQDMQIKHPIHGFHMQLKSKPYALRSRARAYTVD